MMKVFRYLIFLSFLTTFFVLIYKKSDEKGFKRFQLAFKIAVLTAGVASGLLGPINTQELEFQRNDTVYYEKILDQQELNLFTDNEKTVILAKRNDIKPSLPTSARNGGQAPSKFPIQNKAPVPAVPSSRGRTNQPIYLPETRAPAKLSLRLGNAPNPGGNNDPDKSCPNLNVPKSKKTLTHQSHFDKKKKKRRNSHLDRIVALHGRIFRILRSQVEKKTPRHGVDMGLQPDIAADGSPKLDTKTGKPMAKGNKENYNLFAEKLEQFMKTSEMREGYFRKGRANQQEAIHFYDSATDRVASFNKETGEFISFWKMNPEQRTEFLDNNNVI